MVEKNAIKVLTRRKLRQDKQILNSHWRKCKRATKDSILIASPRVAICDKSTYDKHIKPNCNN